MAAVDVAGSALVAAAVDVAGSALVAAAVDVAGSAHTAAVDVAGSALVAAAVDVAGSALVAAAAVGKPTTQSGERTIAKKVTSRSSATIVSPYIADKDDRTNTLLSITC
jgi:hypothetical protein